MRYLKIMQVVLPALTCACGGSNLGVDNSTPRTSVPMAVSGTWSAIHGGTSQFCTEAGSCQSADSTAQKLLLTPDGTFDHTELMESSLYNCMMKVFGHSVGTVTIDQASGTLTMYMQHLAVKSQDNCHAEWNYERSSDKAETFSYTFQVGNDSDGVTALALTDANGKTEIYRAASSAQ